jgi:hypothetical protein
VDRPDFNKIAALFDLKIAEVFTHNKDYYQNIRGERRLIRDIYHKIKSVENISRVLFHVMQCQLDKPQNKTIVFRLGNPCAAFELQLSAYRFEGT